MRQAHGSNNHESPDVVRSLASALCRDWPGIGNDAVAAFSFGLTIWLASQLMGLIFADGRVEPNAPRARSAATTNQMFCDRWGLVPGSREFTLCTQDLQRIRDSLDWRRELFTPL